MDGGNRRERNVRGCMLSGSHFDRCRGIRIPGLRIVGEGISDIELCLLFGIRLGFSGSAEIETKPGPRPYPCFRVPGVSRYRQEIPARCQVAEAIMTLIVDRRGGNELDRVRAV